MIWKPHVTVATIIERDNQYLMVEEFSSGQRVINQPAGHLEEGESLAEAAIRETLEETAWHVELEYISGIYRWQNPEKNNTYLRVCFVAHALSHDEQRELDDGILAALWLDRDSLITQADRLRSPMVMLGIDDYLAGHQYPLSLFTDVS